MMTDESRFNSLKMQSSAEADPNGPLEEIIAAMVMTKDFNRVAEEEDNNIRESLPEKHPHNPDHSEHCNCKKCKKYQDELEHPGFNYEPK